jgi:hypothetical protein
MERAGLRTEVRGRGQWLCWAVGLFLLVTVVGMFIGLWVASHGWLGTGAPDANAPVAAPGQPSSLKDFCRSSCCSVSPRPSAWL